MGGTISSCAKGAEALAEGEGEGLLREGEGGLGPDAPEQGGAVREQGAEPGGTGVAGEIVEQGEAFVEEALAAIAFERNEVVDAGREAAGNEVDF